MTTTLIIEDSIGKLNKRIDELEIMFNNKLNAMNSYYAEAVSKAGEKNVKKCLGNKKSIDKEEDILSS
jgi:hypothetical protein